MTLSDWIRKKILRFLKIEHLSDNPNSDRNVFINDDDDIYYSEVLENKVWYVGNSSELLNFYTGKNVFGFYKNVIYNRNEKNYYWSLSSEETNIKRLHSGVPYAIITTLVNAIGYPIIEICNENAISTNAYEEVEKQNKKLCKILEYNDFRVMYNQEQMPLTMVEGDGAYKINIDKDFAPYPILEYYEAKDVEYIDEYGHITGILYKDYYKNDKGKDFVKIETRRVAKINGVYNSIIEHDLFKIAKNNELIHCDLSEIPELADLETLMIPGLDKILGVPCKFFHNSIYKNRGRSLFDGKKDLFDLLDEIWSQLSATNRVSTPVEYYNVDVLQRTGNGVPILPNRYDRQYVMKEGTPDGDGLNSGKDIETTQPQLNFSQYIEAFKAVLDMILTGLLSPATMGIDIAKKDNADAQREKEKITLMTRDNIQAAETDILRELVTLLMMAQEFIDTETITIQDYDISIKYPAFSNPSFDKKLQYLIPALSQNGISLEKYIELLWGDDLSESEKKKEIDAINEARQADTFNFGNMMPGETTNESENTAPEDLSESEQEE